MSSKCPIPSEMLTAKVFNNKYVSEKILNFVTDDHMKNLDIRRVNNSFNTAFLRIIRKNHRKVKIEIFDDRINKPINLLPSLKHLIPEDYVYINYKRVKITDIDRYFGFVNNVADTKVEKIDTKGLWEMPHSVRLNIHYSIISILIGNNREYIRNLSGMRYICYAGFRCRDCLDLAKRCHEYGPIIDDSLFDMDCPSHFKKLTINDEMLDIFAINASDKAQTKEKCFKKLDELIVSYISCDQLILRISESREIISINNGVETKEAENHRFIPRDILELMIQKWNVKSMGLEFHSATFQCIEYDKWSQKGWFTKFKFSDPYDRNDTSEKIGNLKFSHVNVDLSESKYCVRDLISNNQECIKNKGYENLIGNIRKIFPTNDISIKCAHWDDNIFPSKISTVFESIIKSATKQDPSNLTLNFKYFSKIENFKVSNQTQELIELPYYHKGFQFSIQDPLLHSYHRSIKAVDDNKKFVSEKWMGKRVKLMNHQRNCEINFDIFVNENDLFKIPEEVINEHPHAFIRHFYNV